MTLPVVIVSTREVVTGRAAGVPRGLLERWVPPAGRRSAGWCCPTRSAASSPASSWRCRRTTGETAPIMFTGAAFFSALPAPERLRPDHGDVAPPVRHFHPGAGMFPKRLPYARRAGADQPWCWSMNALAIAFRVMYLRRQRRSGSARTPERRRKDRRQEAVGASDDPLRRQGRPRERELRHPRAMRSSASSDPPTAARRRSCGPSTGWTCSTPSAWRYEGTGAVTTAMIVRKWRNRLRACAAGSASSSRCRSGLPLSDLRQRGVGTAASRACKQEEPSSTSIVERCLQRAALWDEVKDRLGRAGLACSPVVSSND